MDRAAVHPTSTVKAKAGSSKRPISKKNSRKNPATGTLHSPTAELVHSASSTRKRTTRSRQSAAAEPLNSHRKATSDDFLKAAEASPKTVAASEPKGVARRHKVHTTIVDKNTKTESVVSVTRTQAPRKSEAESVADEAATPIILPTIYNKRGHLIVPPPLKGSHEILVRQNAVADRDGLDRIQDDNDLLRMREQHLLVALPVSRALEVDDRLPSDRRFSRPWTAQFLATLAQAHYARFHTSIQINSAVRTVEFQQRLMRTNGNAAPAEGETASPHLTGQAVDIAKHGLSRTEIAWLRGYLLPLIQQGRIDVEEEFQQACFHISVYKKYVPSRSAPRREIADHHSGTAALAAAVQ
jgi:hypothetical protein